MRRPVGHDWTTVWQIGDVVAVAAMMTVSMLALWLIETGLLATDLGLSLVVAVIPITICGDFLYSDWAGVRSIHTDRRIVDHGQARRATPHDGRPQ